MLKGYENLIPEGTSPAYFIWLETDPGAVDVNVSPTKTEVKFEDDSLIFQTLYACVKEALGKNSFVASIDFDREGAPDIPVLSGGFDSYRPVSEPVPSIDPTYDPFKNDGFPSQDSPYVNVIPGEVPPDIHQADTGRSGQSAYQGMSGLSGLVDRREDYGRLFEDKTLPSRSVVVLHNRYIVMSVKSGLLVISVRRARERIFYDRFLKALSRNEHITQCSLFPVQVQVGVENRLLFEEHAALLASLGFDIAPFGNDTVVVNGVPEGYSVDAVRVQSMIYDMIVALRDDHNSMAAVMQSAMAERFARLGAAGDNSSVSAAEAQRLIDALFACENAEYTSSGHKTMIMIPEEELDGKFR